MENKNFDSIVIGAGHAGIEAALALSRTNNKTLLLCLNLDSIGFLACNPSIGGTAKGHLVCEIDALGGQMGITADETALQIRMLNSGKGPAVHSLRAQIDKVRYHEEMKKILEREDNLVLKQAEAAEILTKEGRVCGLRTSQGETYNAKSIVICSGVYLKSKIIIGEYQKESGPNGFSSANELTKSLQELGITILRFKTGTPARVLGKTIDFSKTEKQEGDEDIQSFSFLTGTTPKNISPCFLTYTNEKTHEIIRNNLGKAPVFSGEIVGVGPRYCPSIESKVVRFPDKERHQVFLEPESLSTDEYYIQGMSTSMPAYLQEEIYSTIEGLENAHIMRNAYAIEYDCIDATELKLSLESKKCSGLFFAGQVNGTSGYEEAGAQGIVAGINASQYNKNCDPMILQRSDAYIGVLIDDIVTKGTSEPYRMMTSRAEHRLWLRQDNADVRLTEIGRKFGLVKDFRYEKFLEKQRQFEEAKLLLSGKLKLDDRLIKLFADCGEGSPLKGMTVKEAMKRTGISVFDIQNIYHIFDKFSRRTMEDLNTFVKYEGYINQEKEDIEKARKQESVEIPEDFNFSIKGLRLEAKEKLAKIRPTNLGQASRISGVSPADIAVLSVYLKLSNK